MKSPRPLFLLQLLLLQVTLTAQVQWYQNQDGNNPPPNGTVGTSVQKLSNSSFVACYLWNSNNDQTTWKISKSHINGTEQRCFFVTGTTSQVQVKTGIRYAVYVLKSEYPMGQDPQYTIYKLDSNLNIKAQRTIQFPNGFFIYNMNAFELDGMDNVYVAGDGQYQDGAGYNPASFIVKTDKNLVTKWQKIDSTQTSYTRLNVDSKGNVLVIADYYGFFPDVHIIKLKSNGQLLQKSIVHTDAGRYSLSSSLDNDDNLLLYGGKFTDDGKQAVFLYKVSRVGSRVLYNKTFFTSLATQLYDWKVDLHGDIYCIVSQYIGPDNQVSKVSRINSNNGKIHWSRSFKYAQDSCNLFKLVMNESDRFFVVGEKKYQNLLSRGFALRLKKNSQTDGNYSSPDSVAYQRSHWLTDGITDKNNQLISIGNTNDLDTITYQSTYFRAFAIKFGTNSNNNNYCNDNERGNEKAVDNPVVEETMLTSKPIIYPNPVESNLNIVNLKPNEYDRLAVYNLQGVQLIQQTIQGTSARVNVNSLPGGVYMVVLRSSALLKETSFKFVLRK